MQRVRYGFALLILFVSVAVQAAPGDIIFSDDFERSGLGSDWSATTPNNRSGIGNQTASSPTRSLYLRFDTVTVTSRTFDLSARPGVSLSFWWRRGADSFSEAPDAGEDLRVEVRDASGGWSSVAQFAGDGTPGESGLFTLQLPDNLLMTNFAVRFTLLGGSGNNFDYWHIDDVQLTETAVPVLAECSLVFPAGLTSDVLVNAGPTLTLPPKPWPLSNWPANNATLAAGDHFFQGGVQTAIANITFNTAGGGTTRIFVNGNLTINDDNFRLNPNGLASDLILIVDGNLSVSARSPLINGLLYVTGSLTVGNSPSSSPRLRVTAATTVLGFSAVAFPAANPPQFNFDPAAVENADLTGLCSRPAPFTCIADDFNRTSLGSDWVASKVSGTFTPTIVNNRLRFTENTGNQSTASTMQFQFPAANNKVTIEFDHFAWAPDGGNGADGVALTLSDASVTPQPGGFGGSLGYAQRTGIPGFAGGWLGIGLDEWGNFPAATEGRVGGSGFAKQNVTIRGSGSGSGGYAFLQGTGVISPAIDQRSTAVPGPGHRYRVTVDSTVAGQAMVSVERDTGAGFATLIAPFDAAAAAGQSAIPANFLLSWTGSTGGSRNFHEMDNLEVCALAVDPINVQIDHFELDHDNAALTCSPEPILVKACADASCSTLFTGPVTATLSPAGWVGGDTKSFSGGSASFDLSHFTAGPVTLGVSSSTPATKAFAQTLCKAGAGSPGTNCTLTFSSSGFLLAVPNGIAGKPDTGIKLRAVDTNTQTQQCVPAFANVTKPVSFWSDYINPGPTGRPVSWPVSVNGTDVGNEVTPPATLNLAFDDKGEAALDINYADAGLVQLSAQFTGAGSEAGLVLQGVSQFARRPAGLCVASTNSCAVADGTCPVFTQADMPFPLNMTAVAWTSDADTDFCTGNPPTPNFEMNNIALSAQRSAPLAGVDGVFEPLAYNHVRAPDGLTSVSAKEAEVGVFTFTAAPLANGYLGMSIPAAVSLPIGRFTPHHFDVAETSPGELLATCTAGAPFAYTGQAIGWLLRPTWQVTARSADNRVTQNYTDIDFLKLTTADFMRGFPATDNLATGSDSNLLATVFAPQVGGLGVATPGLLDYQFSMLDSLTYTKSPLSKIAPFNPNVSFSLNSLADSDGVSAAGTAPLLTSTPTASFVVRYGRLRLENAFGSELAGLTLPVSAEYFDGTRFVHNADDACSLLNSSTGSLAPGTLGASIAAKSAGLTAGVWSGGLSLTAPGAGNTGSELLTWTQPIWLQDDFDGNGSLDMPSATATFGTYRGNDAIIYWREIAP